MDQTPTYEDLEERISALETDAEKALRERFQEHKAILKTATDGFWQTDLKGRLIEVNDTYCQMSGYCEQELLSMRIQDLEFDEKAKQITDRIAYLVSCGQDRFERRHRRKDGSIFDVEISARFHPLKEGRIVVFLRDITDQKRLKSAFDKRILALTRPLDDPEGINFEDLFNLNDLQLLQDEFARATGVASIITQPDGTPITAPSNFSRLCSEIIRNSKIGLANCLRSGAVIGRSCLKGLTVQPCLSGGFLSAGAGIAVGGKHMANWLIGQVRDAAQTEADIRAYAREIGVDEDAAAEAFQEIPLMKPEQFGKIGKALFAIADQLSTLAYQNIQQARFITEHERIEENLRQSEERYRGIFDESVSAIYLFDSKKNFIDSNQAGLDLLGYAKTELMSMSIPDVDADPVVVLPAHQQLLNGKRIINYEHRLRKKNGEIITVLNNSIPITDAQGNVTGMQSTLIDISPHKQAEQELRKNQARLRSLINTLPDLVWLKDPDGVYMACNTRFERFFGEKEKDIIGKNDYDFMDKDKADFFRFHDKLAIEKGGPNTNEEAVTFADDGHREILETIKTPMYTDDGQLIGVLGIGRDITERKSKEKIQAAKMRLIDFAATHSNTELLQRVLDEAEALTGSTIGFYHFIEDDQQTLALQTWSTNTLNHLCTAEGAGRHYAISEAGVWVDCVRERKPFIHNDYANLTHKKGLPKGHAPIIRELVVPVIRNEMIKAILGIGNKAIDYTDNDVEIVQQLADLSWETVVYKRAEDAQRESEEKYRSMMEAMNDAAYICSPDFRIEYLNPAMIRRIGRDATGETCHQAINNIGGRCSWCLMDKVQRGLSFKKEIKSPLDGRHYQVSSSPISHRNGTISKMTIYTDITQIKVAEEHLKRAQKLESLGNLAGGIAHDFNNILFPIIGLSEMLVADLPSESFERENAMDILKSAKRASDLVQQILSFSRQTETKRIPIRLQQILKEVFKLMRSTIPANISIKPSIQQECGQVLADPTQIHQIAMNLVTNAYHALEEGGGEISLLLEEKIIDEIEADDSLLKPGRYAVISVTDTGCGIDATILDKIFEPYFTTKKPGKGTGLGLSVVYGIVKDHEGDIRVQSQPGKGTTVHVYLPVIAIENQKGQIAEKADQLPMGTEHILLVDDEEPVIKIEKLILERLGYRVTARVSSIEALEAFKACADAFDLIITDMTMPNMTGDLLSREILNIRPDISIIICTGFSEKMNQQKADALGIKGLLMKPVIKSELAGMVRKVLDEAQGKAQG